ncbi:MAG TPA: DNA polymerase I [Cyanobacteria bacterium UBA8156]|nr:DNA polymerase I [Cyanobacteria bacterium UBA8156]
MSKPLLLLVDGHSLAFRAYYAFAYRGEGGLRTATGVPTSVCFGFLKSLLDVLARETPQAVAIAFDLATPTFRHEADATYKADRRETPEDFIVDLHNLQRLLQALRLPVVTAPGYEADDVLGTLTHRGKAAGYAVKILSGDRDLFQLVEDETPVSVLHLGPKDSVGEYRSGDVQTKMGVTPAQIVDFKALCGDPSDNIPGVRGIGEKTAIKLLQEHPTLAQLWEALPAMKGAIAQKLRDGREAAEHSHFLAQIRLDVPLAIAPADLGLQGFETDEVTPLLAELELKEFIRKLPDIQQRLGGAVAPSAPEGELWFGFTAADNPPAIAPLVVTPEILDTLDKLAAWVAARVAETALMAWDTETTALHPHQADLVGIGAAWADGVVYIPLGHTTGPNLAWADVKPRLAPLLTDPQQPKVLQNAKFDRLVWRRAGLELQGVVFDTMLAHYLVDPEAPHNLSDLGETYLQVTTQSYKELVGKRATIAEVSIPEAAAYCGADVWVTYRLYPLLQAQLQAVPALAKLLYEVELPLEPILADMEWTGIKVDREYLATLSAEFEQDLAAIAHRAFAAAGREFNLNSPKQLSEVLEALLGDTFRQKSRRSAGGYSTDAAVLTKLEGTHPLIDAVMEHRTLAKLKSTYADALPQLIHPATQRIHTDFNQAATATGRLSSSNPNLQNIPVRTPFSRRLRAAFVAEAGWRLLSIDYSQIELRILAHLSQEPELVEAYRAGIDVHERTAQLLLNKSDVTVEERRLAKIINYGIIYGMGAQKLSRETGISSTEARQFIEIFHQRYARLTAYTREMETAAERDGYVTTVLGRRRYFRELPNATKQYRAALLRAAFNAPIQGTSADLIKCATVAIAQFLREGGYQTRLLLQVHDELVFEVPEAEIEAVVRPICDRMVHALPLAVPLVVEAHLGHNWLEAK